MEWRFLLLSGAIGALAGALGWFITRKAKEPVGRGTQLIRISSVVIGIVVGQQFISPIAKDWQTKRDLHSAALDLYGNEEAAALNSKLLLPVIQSPYFERRIKELRSVAASDPKARAKLKANGVADLIARGMARLEITDLAELFDLKRLLSERSPALCAGFWTGQLSTEDLKAGMRTLTKEQQTIWITISARALSREVAAEGPAPTDVTEKDGTDAMNTLVLELPPPEQAAFTAATQQGTPSRDVACKAFHALAVGMEKIPREKRDVILRLLSTAPTAGKP